MTKNQTAVLARFVYMAHWILRARFPSAQISFHLDKGGSLLLHAKVSKNQDRGEESVNPEPGMASAIDGVLASIGITDELYTNGIWVSQRGVSEISTDRYRTHTRWLSVVGAGGMARITYLLCGSLPDIPPGKKAPRVICD